VLDAPDFLRLVVDRVRLGILGHAATGRVDPPGLARALGVDERRILKEIGSLEAAGLMIDGVLIEEALWEIAAAAPRLAGASAEVVDGPWTADEVKTLQTFFSGNRLSRIPEKRAKRLVVLERLALEFDPGVNYPERQVSFMLQLFHPDFAALRRYLVDEGFLTRQDGIYWRSGGRT
jgi:hypothetical protein